MFLRLLQSRYLRAGLMVMVLVTLALLSLNGATWAMPGSGQTVPTIPTAPPPPPPTPTPTPESLSGTHGGTITFANGDCVIAPQGNFILTAKHVDESAMPAAPGGFVFLGDGLQIQATRTNGSSASYVGRYRVCFRLPGGDATGVRILYYETAVSPPHWYFLPTRYYFQIGDKLYVTMRVVGLFALVRPSAH